MPDALTLSQWLTPVPLREIPDPGVREGDRRGGGKPVAAAAKTRPSRPGDDGAKPAMKAAAALLLGDWDLETAVPTLTPIGRHRVYQNELIEASRRLRRLLPGEATPLHQPLAGGLAGSIP
jgi:hypothetical protein